MSDQPGARPAEVNAPALIGTFLMTDIEGSTRLWEEHPDAMPVALAAHDAALRAAIEGHAGLVIKTTGDGLLARFDDPTDALAAALDGQRAMRPIVVHGAGPLRVRIALHTGTAQGREGDFFGPALNRVARLLAIGHGGQVLLSGVTVALTAERLPPGASVLDSGEHRLRDLEQPEHVYQLAADDLPRDFPPLRSLGSAAANLPTQATSFVGRERDLAEVDGLLARSRLVTLIGTGGTGKTRLMLEVATRSGRRFRDGAWLVELAPVSDPDLVVSEASRALGAREQPGVMPIETLVDFLRYKALLLLLDNCEHVIGAAAELVERLLASCPSLVVLATGREALGIAGETVFQVPSLAVPTAARETGAHDVAPEDAIAAITSADAVRLFVERATAVVPGFSLTLADARAVAEICRRLDGIPLAIELAAARVTVLSVEEILQRLGDRFRLLTGGRRTAVPRQQTLQALIDWSWDLLDEPDRRTLRRLSVLSGGWTLDAAVAVCVEPGEDATDALDALERLVERSLVLVERGARTRYRLLETIRQYARDRLVESGEADTISARHLGHFLDLAERAEPMLRGPDMIEWLERLDAETENVRAAIEWALEGDPGSAARLCIAMWLWWRVRAIGLEGITWMREALERVRALPAGDGPTMQRRDVLIARLLTEVAFTEATWLGVDRRSAADEALAVARRAGDDAAVIAALSAVWITRFFAADIIALPDLAAEQVALAEASDDRFVVAMATAASAAAAGIGDAAGAETLLARASEQARATGNPFVVAFVTITRARSIGLDASRLTEARALFAEAFTAFTELGDPRFALAARSDFAHALRRAGEWLEAEAIYRETIHGWQHTGNRGAIASQLDCFAYLALHAGDAARGARLLGAAEALREAAATKRLHDEVAEYERAAADVRAALGPAAFESAWASGRALDAEAAVVLAVSG